MPCISYVDKRFSGSSLSLIHTANDIIHEYEQQGFSLTLRQLYYQFVSRDLLRNDQKEYKRLGSIINDARLAGYVDWSAIEDRTRNLRSLGHWNSPEEILTSCAQQYRMDRWATQGTRPEVWIEKDALIGVIEQVCNKWDVGFFSCRGYTSQSEMWEAAQRYNKRMAAGQSTLIIHLGDHDPSGVDMSRDISDRLDMFCEDRLQGCCVSVKRVALTWKQIQQYNPPPNPAKLTDSRATGYISQYGNESWELDALEPSVIAKLISDEIEKLVNPDKWSVAAKLEQEGREVLREFAEQSNRRMQDTSSKRKKSKD